MESTITDTIEIIKRQLKAHSLVLYMKGTPDAPCCGFSARVVQILKACDRLFHHINVLENQAIRRSLPTYSRWPTFPQLYCRGELIGGCDIVEQLYKTGDLERKIRET